MPLRVCDDTIVPSSIYPTPCPCSLPSRATKILSPSPGGKRTNTGASSLTLRTMTFSTRATARGCGPPSDCATTRLRETHQLRVHGGYLPRSRFEDGDASGPWRAWSQSRPDAREPLDPSRSGERLQLDHHETWNCETSLKESGLPERDKPADDDALVSEDFITSDARTAITHKTPRSGGDIAALRQDRRVNPNANVP